MKSRSSINSILLCFIFVCGNAFDQHQVRFFPAVSTCGDASHQNQT